MTVATEQKLILAEYLNYQNSRGQRFEILDGVSVAMRIDRLLCITRFDNNCGQNFNSSIAIIESFQYENYFFRR
jgi:hypothetical protein